MGEIRAGDMPRRAMRVGQGSITSREGAKQQIGRTFMYVGKGGHQGHPSNTTEYQANRRLTKGPEKPPTPLEMDMALQDNPKEVNALRASGMNDRQIYDVLKERD